MSSEEEQKSGSEMDSDDSEQEVQSEGSDDENEEVEDAAEQSDGKSETDEPQPAVDKYSRESELMEQLFGNKEQLIGRLRDDQDRQKDVKSEDRKRKPVWEDSDDEAVKVQEGMRRSGVRHYLQDPDRKYKQQLSQKFQKIVGEPKWAKLDRDEDSSDDSDNEALKRVGHVLQPDKGPLPKTTLDYRRLRDLNKVTANEGPTVTCVEFHPNSRVGLVAGASGVASLLSVEPKSCEKLHSICFEKFQISCGRFSKGGEEAIFGGNKKNFIYTFDLLGGQTRKSMLPRSEIKSARKFEISPDGQTMAVAGWLGEIHLLHARTKEWMATMKQEHEVSGLAFSVDSQRLLVNGRQNEVNVFDLRTHRTSHRFIDDGCITGKTIAMSPNGQLLALGSAEGIVNVYDAEAVMRTKFPQPIKVISNLATAITYTRFNPTSEILAVCSRETQDGIKLVHFPSATVFANFPLNTKSFGQPNRIAFSPGGRYMAVGTGLFNAPLYELKHYAYF